MTDLQIEQQITDFILHTYGESSVKTAFITGSIAAGKARPDSDVDILLCYQDTIDSPELKKEEFIKFYFDIHRRLNRTPDTISPGEILSFSEIYNAVIRIKAKSPSAVLDREDFDAICWAGMLVSKRNILITDSPEIEELITVARSVVYEWASQLAPETVLTFNTGEHTDVDKVLRAKISSPGYYDAH